MPLITLPASLGAAELVVLLGDTHRGFQACQRLIALGPGATEAVRAGLAHPDPRVRAYCCMVLDHLMDEASVPVLIAALGDPAEQVRCAAAHALSCDRCKKGGCRPDAAAVLAAALDVLAGDESASVRAMAVEVAGRWVHSHPQARAAIERAAAADASPAVRKKASWYAPGGTIYRRTEPGSAQAC